MATDDADSFTNLLTYSPTADLTCVCANIISIIIIIIISLLILRPN